jgi:hypothetical protein
VDPRKLFQLPRAGVEFDAAGVVRKILGVVPDK